MADGKAKASKQIIRPYGDRRDDGVIQMSFTLPVPYSEKAREAALILCEAMGFKDVQVHGMEKAAESYTMFVVYARTEAVVDYAAIKTPDIVIHKMGFDELNALIGEKIKRKLVVLGACTGTDTHTVGIDAILNMKGYSGDYGLERYPWFDAYNLGSQVPNEELIRKAIEKNADAILVSQVVTQRDVHKDNSRQFIEVAKKAGIHKKMILLLGGPRVDHKLATELEFDAGFGPGTKPSAVANYIVHEILQRTGQEPKGTKFEGAPT